MLNILFLFTQIFLKESKSANALPNGLKLTCTKSKMAANTTNRLFWLWALFVYLNTVQVEAWRKLSPQIMKPYLCSSLTWLFPATLTDTRCTQSSFLIAARRQPSKEAVLKVYRHQGNFRYISCYAYVTESMGKTRSNTYLTGSIAGVILPAPLLPPHGHWAMAGDSLSCHHGRRGSSGT